VIGRFETVDVRDAGMIEGCQQQGFAPEPREAFRIVRERLRQNVQRDVTLQLRVTRAIDLAIPPAPTRARTS
jgi:hypothetical protein